MQLISGDMTVGADGTVTAIDGDKIYAFGHRLLDEGSTDLPFARAEVLAATLLLATGPRPREQVDAALAMVGCHRAASVDPQRFSVTCSVLATGLPLRLSVVALSWAGPASRLPHAAGALPPSAPPWCPAPGRVLPYPGGLAGSALAFPYGHCGFAGKAGPLAANHLMTIGGGREQLRELGVKVLWEGALDIEISRL